MTGNRGNEFLRSEYYRWKRIMGVIMARVVTIPIGPIFTGGPCRGIIHVIEQGDTLYLLGKRYHVSVSSIMYANPFVNIYNLQVGDELCIPVGVQARSEEEMESRMPESRMPESRMPEREEEPMEF